VNHPNRATDLGSLRYMAEPDDSEERISALEADAAALRARLGRAEQDAAAARILAGGADRDVADLGGELREFRAEVRGFRDQNNHLLSAMREDLTDLRRHVDEGFAGMRGLLDGQAAWNRQIADMLGVLIRRQDDDQPPGGRTLG
jgi:hypothetical protein